MTIAKMVLAASGLALGVASAQATIMLTSDPDFPIGAPVFTVDPELESPASRGVAGTRELRQSFQLGTDLDVTEIVIAINLDPAASNGGLDLNFYEVADVNASSWNPGSLVHSLSIPTTTALPDSTVRLGLELSDADVFTLTQRDTGTEGYAIEISNGDGTSNIGLLRHSNGSTNPYTAGIFYKEDGNISGANRDLGIALIPEPSVAMLMLGGVGLLSLVRRRNR